MNRIKHGNKIYKYEGVWREARNKFVKDSYGKPFPYPDRSKKKWILADAFVKNLQLIEDKLDKEKKYYTFHNGKTMDCLFKDKKNVATKIYKLGNVYWEDSLTHYIKEHNVKPSTEFINYILSRTVITGKKKQTFRLPSLKFAKYGKQYLKIDKNQLMVLDALMKHGSYDKKYPDPKSKKKFRYSEHAGLLDFNHIELEKILVSGKTNRVDVDDDEIYLPINMKEAYDYEYIFHTHPATPRPGGRANAGILYEFPSINDIIHFYEHYSGGLTQGSIVIAPEGLYVIRKYVFDNTPINLDDKRLMEMANKANKLSRLMQDKALKKFGKDFDTYYFYNTIAQDTSYINEINELLHKYELHIDFQPRKKDSHGRWFLDTIYLPVYAVEPLATPTRKPSS